MILELIDDKVGGFKVVVNGTHFGSFDQINGNSEPFRYFPKLTDRMTGDHFVMIGQELNRLNQKFSKTG
ncbi:hypothetical protein VIBNISOn1_1080005 [Vibrio nigripulchritudo SOn1]|uniref:Galectin n=1 Tax=Vibrio nigripulchritudo SOn1 TaxID=1238450 RepID=A0AAV2VHZ1_9VIBR|nr:hypothetical protein [Vibrio nigripulchritudo]CCO44288.1 hypothetical protein VIBNISOn1_1080005 [Vibrio nigripulchritudo SOn1]